jgi:hypothetical protein
MITCEQAKAILSTRRPGSPAATDPELVEALRLAEREPDLRRWWEERQRFDAGVRAVLQAIPVPPDLAGRILAGRPAPTLRLPAPRRWVWALAAAAVFTLAGWLVWWSLPSGPQFPTYRNRMARVALREYRMDIQTNDLSAIQGFLARNQAPADYTLTPPMRALPGLGCGVVRWQNQPVSMVCFDRGQGQILWLFVAENTAVAGAPKSRQPVFDSVGRLATAAWSDGRHLYLLAAVGDRQVLEKFL